MFRELPLLERMVPTRSPVIDIKLSSTMLVAVQHLLETTGSLLQKLCSLGLRPENAFVLGKAYSSNSDVARRLRALGLFVDPGSLPASAGDYQEALRGDVNQLWSRALTKLRRSSCSQVVILDDGGRCISMVPEEVHRLTKVSGVEQTTSGLACNKVPHSIRIVEVATAATKRVLESPMISRAVVRRMRSLEGADPCGVIGVGNIGGCVVSDLLNAGRTVLAYDRDPSRSRAFATAQTVSSLAELVRKSQLVIGCTGDDVFADVPRLETLEWWNGGSTLVSCSSEDREFRSLLSRAKDAGCLEQWTALGMAVLQLPARVSVLRGGFPLNFDGTVESVPGPEIQLTRALLLGGVIQAALCDEPLGIQLRNGRMLDPRFQARSAQGWFELRSAHRKDYSSEVVRGSCSEKWVAEHSGGLREDTSAMRAALSMPY